MKKRAPKIITALSIILALGTISTETTLAAASKNWAAYYQQGVPESAANPTAYVSLPYDASGFIAECTSLSGSYNRMVEITSSDAGGINQSPIQITAANKQVSFKMRGATTGNVTFKIHATGATSCSATGYIKQAM